MTRRSRRPVRGAIVAAAAALLALAAPTAALAAEEQVKDGSFEAGSPAWVFEGGTQRCEAATTCGPVGAASGSFYAATPTITSVPPGSPGLPLGTVTQLVPTPELPATLTFKLRELHLGTLNILLEVKYGGEKIDEINSAGESFEPETVAIPAVLTGASPKALAFSFTCFNLTPATGQCPRFDLDDVSVLTGPPTVTTPPPGSPGSGNGGGSGGSGGGGGGSTSTPPDRTPPETTLGRYSRTLTVASSQARAKTKVRFSSEPGAHFECSLDHSRFSSCTSPRTLKLKPGGHLFEVRAIDAAGNVDKTPAKAKIRVKVA